MTLPTNPLSEIIEVQPDLWAHEAEFSMEKVREVVARFRADGIKEIRCTIDVDDKYGGGFWMEGWDRNLRWPEAEARFNPPMTYKQP